MAARKSTSIDKELNATRSIYAILSEFDLNAVQRIMDHIADYLDAENKREIDEQAATPTEGEPCVPPTTFEREAVV